MKLSAYIASPLGFSEAGRLFYQQELLPLVDECGFDVIDPWTLTPQSEINKVLSIKNLNKQKTAWQRLNLIIGERNRKGIDECDIVVAILDGVDVDSGTASEIGYSYAQKKLVIGYRGDFRLSADNIGGIVNLQVEYFIRDSGGNIATIFYGVENSLCGLLQDARSNFASGGI